MAQGHERRQGDIVPRTHSRVFTDDNQNSEFWKSKEAENAAAVYGSSLVSAGLQVLSVAYVMMHL